MKDNKEVFTSSDFSKTDKFTPAERRRLERFKKDSVSLLSKLVLSYKFNPPGGGAA